MKNIKLILFAFVATVILYSCSPAEGDYPGSEYMPDMGHSLAVEGNVYTYYYFNTWDSASTVKLKDLTDVTKIGRPVEGTVPRGYAGIGLTDAAKHTKMMKTLRGADAVNSIAVPVNGNVPYYYADTEEERLRATEEIIENPFPITANGLERGEELYNTFCAICHGEKGNGLGYLVAEENPNAKYPAAPANFLVEPYANSSNGRYYHSIMWGKNVMGHYKDKISYEERWQVIHWIRALQAKEKGLKYNENENTLNPEFGMPYDQYIAMYGDSHSDSHDGEGAGASDTHQDVEHHNEVHDGEHEGEHLSDSGHSSGH